MMILGWAILAIVFVGVVVAFAAIDAPDYGWLGALLRSLGGWVAILGFTAITMLAIGLVSGEIR